MQAPESVENNLRLADVKPSVLLEGEVPHLIDEWQMAPKLWDAVRFEVDRRDEFGQFILTGSSTPVDTSQIHHTGIGRITRMLMRPMSLFESGESSGSISLKDLFAGGEVSGKSALSLEQIAFLICRGGWPKAIGANERVALRQAQDYCREVVRSDISRADDVARSATLAERLMRSYARVVATQATVESISRDMSSEEKVSSHTAGNYIEALRKIFVIEEAAAWCPNLRAKSPIRTTPTRYFVDPSIGAAALGLGPADLMNDLNTMGLYFENLCFRDLRIYADLLDGVVYHYKDKSGLECDAVVHLRNGSYGLIEIKLGGNRLIEEGMKTLEKLASNLDTTRMKSPAFKMVLTGVGDYAYRTQEGIYIVPIGALKP